MRNETARDVTCDCTYEAVVIEDGLARPVLLASGLISETADLVAECGLGNTQTCSGGTSVIKDLHTIDLVRSWAIRRWNPT